MQPTCFGIPLDRLVYTMGAEYGDRLMRHFVESFDKDRALGLQTIDHRLVMDDFMAYVDRRAVPLQRALDNVDGAYHAGAETTGLSKNDPH